MTRLAIIAAMPGELKPLVAGWPHSTRAGIHFWAQRNEDEEWIAACAGAGQTAATRAFAGIEDGGPVDLVFSIGWAGALRPEIATGSAHNVAGVIDVRTGERFHCEAGTGDLWLATSSKVADRTEKRRLATAYNAALVDMEAAAIARLAAVRGIPFYAIKGVSDGANDRLPDFNPFLEPDGRFRLVPFVLSSLVRPWYWPALLRMGDNSRKASQSIAELFREFLKEQPDDA
jgi:adenosylhomocysteine nucleosidase